MASMFEIVFLICAVLGFVWLSRTRLVLVALLMAGLLGMATPAAAAETERCSYGDAKAQWQAFYPIFRNVPRDTDIPPCQYRIWLDKYTFTFTEDDYFLAGNALGYDYQAAGITRGEGISYLERIGNRLWLAKIGTNGKPGPLVEQKLNETGYRNTIDTDDPDAGVTVYRQVGTILHLPPGDYLSVFKETFDGRPSFNAKVILHIVPSG